MKRLCIFGILALLVSCKSAKPAIFDKDIFWYDNLSADEMLKIEERLNSDNISEESKTAGFGIGIYPNEKKFDLQKPNAFVRESDKDLPLKVFTSLAAMVSTGLYYMSGKFQIVECIIKNYAKNAI